MFRSRVINEKRVEKAVGGISPHPMVIGPKKSIFGGDSELDQIWWKSCRHLVECVCQISSALDRYFSRKNIKKINDICHFNCGTDLVRLHIDQLTFYLSTIFNGFFFQIYFVSIWCYFPMYLLNVSVAK